MTPNELPMMDRVLLWLFRVCAWVFVLCDVGLMVARVAIWWARK